MQERDSTLSLATNLPIIVPDGSAFSSAGTHTVVRHKEFEPAVVEEIRLLAPASEGGGPGGLVSSGMQGSVQRVSLKLRFNRNPIGEQPAWTSWGLLLLFNVKPLSLLLLLHVSAHTPVLCHERYCFFPPNRSGRQVLLPPWAERRALLPVAAGGHAIHCRRPDAR